MRIAVIPALDEGRAIGSVVLRAKAHADRVIVVDDGSSDDTAVVAVAGGAQVLRHEVNQGKGAALATGISTALAMGAAVIVLLDGDGQHDAQAIPSLVAPIESGEADLVIGVRVLKGEGAIRRHRRLGRRVLDHATNVVARTGVSDTQSGYRAISAAAARKLLPREAGMGVESVMLAQAGRNGMRVTEVAVLENYPMDVRPSQHPARHGMTVLGGLLRFIREEHPLAFFGTIGVAMLAYGGIAGYLTASHYYATDEFWLGKAMQSMLFLVLGSIALLGAMILDFISIKFPRRSGP